MILNIKGKGKAEVGVYASLMKFIEDDETDPRKIRVRVKHPRENSFCNHLDARPLANNRIASDAVSDGLSDPFAELIGHVGCSATRCEPAGFQHENFLACQPRVMK